MGAPQCAHALPLRATPPACSCPLAHGLVRGPGALRPCMSSSRGPFPCVLQAGYDNLVWDLCQPRYGDTKDPAAQAASSLLSYLTNEYNLVPSKRSKAPIKAPAQGTKDK